MSMSKEAKAARAAYMREYRKKNRERFKKMREQHWERKASEQKTAKEGESVT